MKKILFISLNAKYIHTNLALRSIGAYCSEFSPHLKEYTINDNIDSIIGSIHSEKADVVAFSCYIWNIEKILYISECLKKVNPNIIIILGGHEVSYDSKAILTDNPYVDFIIRGAGEKPMHALLNAIENNRPYRDVPSLCFRDNDDYMETPLSTDDDINDYPFCYDSTIKDYMGKIIYYESSRGCPYRCSYCLSGNGSGVNYLEIERVKKELMFFIENEVPLVKFVDRTFNADKKRAMEIWRFIIKNNRKTKFHFEIAGNLLDDEALKLLKKAPAETIQFEIGVQSVNPDTHSAIGRNISLEKLKENVTKLAEYKNIHIHLDLIAGLPYENYESFKKSFDDVLGLKPDCLQLGFLKLLKGSKIREEADKYHYKYKSKAPYEVMENDFISFDELIKLKYIEDLLEKTYNSGEYKRTMEFLFEKYDSPFCVFERMYDYYSENALFEKAVSLEMRYELMNDIFKLDGLPDCIKADRLTNPKAKMAYENETEFKEKCFEFLKRDENVLKYLPQFEGVAPRKIYKKLRFEKMFGGIYMYDGVKLAEITQEFEKL